MDDNFGPFTTDPLKGRPKMASRHPPLIATLLIQMLMSSQNTLPLPLRLWDHFLGVPLELQELFELPSFSTSTIFFRAPSSFPTNSDETNIELFNPMVRSKTLKYPDRVRPFNFRNLESEDLNPMTSTAFSEANSYFPLFRGGNNEVKRKPLFVITVNVISHFKGPFH